MAPCIWGTYAACQAVLCWCVDINSGLARTLSFTALYVLPDSLMELQIMYAGTKLALQKEADLTRVYEVRELDELTEQWLQEKLCKWTACYSWNMSWNFCCNDQIDPFTIGSCEGAWYCARFIYCLCSVSFYTVFIVPFQILYQTFWSLVLCLCPCRTGALIWLVSVR